MRCGLRSGSPSVVGVGGTPSVWYTVANTVANTTANHQYPLQQGHLQSSARCAEGCTDAYFDSPVPEGTFMVTPKPHAWLHGMPICDTWTPTHLGLLQKTVETRTQVGYCRLPRVFALELWNVEAMYGKVCPMMYSSRSCKVSNVASALHLYDSTLVVNEAVSDGASGQYFSVVFRS